MKSSPKTTRELDPGWGKSALWQSLHAHWHDRRGLVTPTACERNEKLIKRWSLENDQAVSALSDVATGTIFRASMLTPLRFA